MTNCQNCGQLLAADATDCRACGATAHERPMAARMAAIYAHLPHPHIQKRKQQAPVAPADDSQRGPLARFNAYLAVQVTGLVGTMWCAYAFAVLAMISLPAAIHGGTPTLISWIAQTFLQLVLLSIIIVGQKVAGEASDKRALDTYNDAEAILHEAVQIQAHLTAQDAVLQTLLLNSTSARAPLSAAPPE